MSAQIDRAFNEFQERLFGFLELEDDIEDGALLDAAAGWLRERGRDRMVGPMDFTMNDESGVLIEGFEREPMIRQAAPALLPAPLRGGGAQKSVDTYMWSLHISGRENVMPIIWDLAEKLEPKHGIRIRKMSRLHLRRDLDAFAEIYNEAWSRNFGFVLYTKEDVDAYAQEQPRLRPRLVHDRRGLGGEDGRHGDHGAGHQPGAEADERPGAAERLVALPEPAPHRRPLPGRLPGRGPPTPSPGWPPAYTPSTSTWPRPRA